MAKQSSTNFEIPAEMRAIAEKSVEQARQAFDTFISAAQQAATSDKRASGRLCRRQGGRRARRPLCRAQYRRIVRICRAAGSRPRCRRGGGAQRRLRETPGRHMAVWRFGVEHRTSASERKPRGCVSDAVCARQRRWRRHARPMRLSALVNGCCAASWRTVRRFPRSPCDPQTFEVALLCLYKSLSGSRDQPRPPTRVEGETRGIRISKLPCVSLSGILRFRARNLVRDRAGPVRFASPAAREETPVCGRGRKPLVSGAAIFGPQPPPPPSFRWHETSAWKCRDSSARPPAAARRRTARFQAH